MSDEVGRYVVLIVLVLAAIGAGYLLAKLVGLVLGWWA